MLVLRNVSPGWYPIGFALSFFVCFLVVVVCLVFFELALWLFVSLSLWVLIQNQKKKKKSAPRFSFASLSCVKFCRLDVNSVNYKKLAFGFNLDNTFASDTEYNEMSHSFQNNSVAP